MHVISHIRLKKLHSYQSLNLDLIMTFVKSSKYMFFKKIFLSDFLLQNKLNFNSFCDVFPFMGYNLIVKIK